MVRLHTAQLNVGKLVKARPTAFFVDCTVKTGGAFVKQCLSPSWDLLQRYKRKECTSEGYATEYLRHLDHNANVIVERMENLAKYSKLEDLILGCYCGRDEFCHRHLLQRWLIQHCDCFEKGSELGPGNIYTGDEPTKIVFSIVGDVEFRARVRKEYPCVLSSHEFFEYADRGDKPISDYAVEVKAALVEFANERFKARTGPIIDLSDLGNVMVTCSDEANVTHMLDKEITDWRLVRGEMPYILEYLQKYRFAPTFEITAGTFNADFNAEMDAYYASNYTSL